jgi:lysophospholipase L1-like esterase
MFSSVESLPAQQLIVNESDERIEGAVARDYFAGLMEELNKKWPQNRTIRFLFHGHSVPAGYFRDGNVRRFDSYPILFHQQMSDLFSNAVIDVCTTAIGGERAEQGANRFDQDVLAMNPDVVLIDYSLNDRKSGLAVSEKAWRRMIQLALDAKVKVVLLTPTPDSRENILDNNAPLAQHAAQVRKLGREFQVPVVDSYAMFRSLVAKGAKVEHYLSQSNHPNRRGHEKVAELILALFKSTPPNNK